MAGCSQAERAVEAAVTNLVLEGCELLVVLRTCEELQLGLLGLLLTCVLVWPAAAGTVGLLLVSMGGSFGSCQPARQLARQCRATIMAQPHGSTYL